MTRREPDTDSHGTSIVGPSMPDATGYPDLDRKRRFWRALTFGGIAVGLLLATVVPVVLGDPLWIIAGMGVALAAFLVGGFGNGAVSERARARRDVEAAERETRER